MSGKKIWLQLAVAGKFLGHKSGAFEMDANTFDQCVRNFDRDGVEVQWDIGHASEAGNGSAPAVGWISRLERRGNTLWGLTEWLPDTAEAIRQKRWQYASPALRLGARDPVSGKNIGAKLSSMALVSRGFLKNLAPVQASDDQRGDLVYCSEISIEDEQELIPMSEHESLLADGIAQATEPLTVRLAETEADLADMRVMADVAEAQREALAAQVKLLSDQIIDSRLDDAFLTYRESKKLTANSRKMMRLLLTSDPQSFEQEYPQPKGAPGYLLRTLSDDHSDSPAPRGIKTVPPLSEMIANAKTEFPNESYDQQFDRALAGHQALVAGVAQ